MAAIFSPSVSPSESIASCSSSCAVVTSANPLCTAPSIRPSFAVSEVVWLPMASSIAESLSSIEPPSDSRAVRKRSCWAWPSANPAATAASISDSFVSRLVVCAFSAASMAASFSDIEPLSEDTAVSISFIAASLSAIPSRTDASISASLSASDWFDCRIAAMTSLKSDSSVMVISGCGFSQAANSRSAKNKTTLFMGVSFMLYFERLKRRPSVAYAWPFGAYPFPRAIMKR